MPYSPTDVVEVFCWEQRVGAVALDAGTAYYVFQYDPAWQRTGIELAPLHMPNNSRLYVFPNLPEVTYWRLPALLADSLPDDFGNALIDAYLAQQGVARDRITPLDRLTYLSKRGLGALEFRPPKGPRQQSTAVEIGSLVTTARHAVHGSLSTDSDSSDALRQLIAVGTSAGGARAKAVVAWNEATDEMRSGQAGTQEGFEQWILKFDGMGIDKDLGPSQHYGRVEYAYWLMATAAGITMSRARLLHENRRGPLHDKEIR